MGKLVYVHGKETKKYKKLTMGIYSSVTFPCRILGSTGAQNTAVAFWAPREHKIRLAPMMESLRCARSHSVRVSHSFKLHITHLSLSLFSLSLTLSSSLSLSLH